MEGSRAFKKIKNRWYFHRSTKAVSILIQYDIEFFNNDYLGHYNQDFSLVTVSTDFEMPEEVK